MDTSKEKLSHYEQMMLEIDQQVFRAFQPEEQIMADQFDFDVGLDDLEPVSTTTKTRKHNPATPAPVSIYISNNIDTEGSKQDIDIAAASARDLKSPLNASELKFIELHLVEKVGKDEAMISAGYGRYGQRWRLIIGSRIIQKYESRAQDRRNLFRELGAGEVAICQGLLEIAQNERNPVMARRAAWADLASCMGLKSEQIENFQGVTLNVYSQAEAERLGIKPKVPASSGPLEPQHIQITK